jgi:hypothetical protein
MTDGDQNKFIPQLPIDTSAIFPSLYDVKPKAQSEWCVPYCAIGNMVSNCQLLYIVQDCTVALKGSHRMGDRRIFSKNLRASLSLMTTYRMSLVLAGSISLDSTWEEDVKA